MQASEGALPPTPDPPLSSSPPSTAKSFQCPTCAASYTRRHGLSRHLLSCQSSLRPHKCPHCPLSFALPHLLRDHRRTHLPSSPASFRCPHCPRTFASRRSRQRHAQSHQGGQHRCEVDGCERRFVTLYELRAHARRHRPAGQERRQTFTCGRCGRGLSSQRSLEGHLQRRHGQEKPPPAPPRPAGGASEGGEEKVRGDAEKESGG